MSERLDSVLSVALVTAAAVLATALIHREFFAQPSGSASPPSRFVSDWKSVASSGRLLGNPAAPVRITEFADLQCPFCAAYDSSIRRVRQEFPTQVAFLFVHFPLTQHRFASSAARAAECAAVQGRFDEMTRLLYAKQDSFGTKPWLDYAREVSIHDTAVFARCISETETPTLVSAGAAAGARMQVRGTPTILLNGWRYGTPPSDTELTRAIADILSGRKPYSGYRLEK